MTTNIYYDAAMQRAFGGSGGWQPNTAFGTYQAGASFAQSDVRVFDPSGSVSGRVVWPAPDGTGKPANMVAVWPIPEAFEGVTDWTAAVMVYVPSGSPNVRFDSIFKTASAYTSVKDEWVELRAKWTHAGGPGSWFLSVNTEGAPVAETECFIGAVMVVPEDYDGPFFTGSTDGARWFGQYSDSWSTTDPIPAPEVAVEVAWTDPFNAYDPEWTDISEYVQGVTSQVGRAAETVQVEAGDFGLVVDNSSGAFTPGNVNSPFYPNVGGRRQFRVRPITEGGEVPEPDILVNLNPRAKRWTAASPLMTPGFDGFLVEGTDLFVISGNEVLFAINDPGPYTGLVKVRSLNPDTDPTGFAGVQGDYVSGRAQAGVNFADDLSFNADFSVRVEELDAAGNAVAESTDFGLVDIVRNGGNDTVEPEWVTAQFVNYQLTHPDTVAWRVVAVVNIVADAKGADSSQTNFHVREVSAFNTGSVAYEFPNDAVPFFSGDDESGAVAGFENYDFHWSGVPGLSESLAVERVGSGPAVARGYIHGWGATLNGLSAETTLDCTDWFSSWAKQSLPIRYEAELMRRGAVDIFPLITEGGEQTEFAAWRSPDERMRRELSYRETHQAYEFFSADVPTLEAAEYSLLQANPDVPALAASGQSGHANGGNPVFLGNVVKASPPPFRVAQGESWAWSWRYRYDGDAMSGLEDEVIVASFRDPSTLAEIRILHAVNPDPTETKDRFLYFAFKNAAGDWENEGPAGNILIGSPVQFVASWNGDTEQFMFSWTQYYGPGIFAEGEANILTSYQAAYFDAVAHFAGSSLSVVDFLGYNEPSINVSGGFANHAVSYVARHDRALTADDVEYLNTAAESLEGATVSGRLHAALDVAGWPVESRYIAPDSTQLATPSWERGTKARDAIAQSVESSAGVFLFDNDGRARYMHRHERPESVVTWVLDCDGATGIESGVTFEMDEDDLINVAEVDNLNGVKTQVRDDASIEQFGEAEQSYSLMLANQNTAVQFGYHRVNRYGQPFVRANAVTINPSAHASGDLWPMALEARVGDRLLIRNLPDHAPSGDMECFIESVGHGVVRNGATLEWLVTYNISPAHLEDAWILGDTVRGVLGGTTVPHF